MPVITTELTTYTSSILIKLHVRSTSIKEAKAKQMGIFAASQDDIDRLTKVLEGPRSQ